MYYNKLERLIARFLECIPCLKRVLKVLYQRLNFYIYKKSYTYLLKVNLNSVFSRWL